MQLHGASAKQTIGKYRTHQGVLPRIVSRIYGQGSNGLSLRTKRDEYETGYVHNSQHAVTLNP